MLKLKFKEKQYFFDLEVIWELKHFIHHQNIYESQNNSMFHNV